MRHPGPLLAVLLQGVLLLALPRSTLAVVETIDGGPPGPAVQARTQPPPAVLPPGAAGRPLTPNNSGAWILKRDWNRREIALYAQWITQIHEKKTTGTWKQRAAKFSQIVQDKEMNLLLQQGFADDNNDLRLFDSTVLSVMNSANACGTFPILTFLYYCAARWLPASFTKVSGDGGDIRYSRGNHPVRRIDPLGFRNPVGFFRALFFGSSNYTTGNWRTAPDLEGTDTVPVSVSPESTIPGLTVLYNSDGHGLLVSRVSSTGTVNMLDGHPDGSITAGQTMAALASVLRGIPEKNREAWYAGFRMIRLARCVTDPQGRIVGIRPYTNEEMRFLGFSDEQYTDIIAMNKGQPVDLGGKPTKLDSYPEYVRRRLQTCDQLDVRATIVEWAAQLRTLFNERATFVDLAWDDVQRNGPITLPDDRNIYQADGRWERWSSPSSDCDRKGAYFLGVDLLDQLVRDFDPAQSKLILTGFGRPIRSRKELAEAVLQEKKRVFDASTVPWTTSRGRVANLTLGDIEQRLFTMSFDPNHAPEVRWGVSPDSPEAAACRQISTPLASGGRLSPLESYRREQRLRFRLLRKDGRTSFDDADNPVAPLKQLFDPTISRYLK